MNYTSAIKDRASRRSYLGTNIADDKLKILNEKIEEANAQSGLNIVLANDIDKAFNGTNSYGMFSGVRDALIMKGKADLPHLKEKVGYYGERLVLDATDLSLGTCWVGGTFNKSNIAPNAADDEEIICVITIGNVTQSNSFKEKFIRGMIHRKSKTILEMINENAILNERLANALELVRLAPTTRNTQKVKFTIMPLEISASVPDDYPFDLVDLGICKLHFECGMGGKFALGNNALWRENI